MNDTITRLQALKNDPEAFEDFEGAFSKALDTAEAKQAERQARANETPEQRVEREKGVLLAQLRALPVNHAKRSPERVAILAKLKALTPEIRPYTGKVYKEALDFDNK